VYSGIESIETDRLEIGHHLLLQIFSI